MKQYKKIGIMGGTFNPIHKGHIEIAQHSFEQFELDMVLFIPANHPPHKDSKEIISNALREDMTKLAIEEYKEFIFSDIELKRSGYTYTVETLKELEEQYQKSSFYFILGMDSLSQIEKWRGVKELFTLCTILIAGRDNSSQEEINTQIHKLSSLYNANIQPINMPNINISSTQIREAIKNNRSISHMVCKKVEEYIYKNQLYVD